MSDSTTRFSDRVANYVRYRPGYPPGTVEALQSICGLGTESRVADMGSGTGIFTALLLDCCERVYAIEPNDSMSEVAESAFEGNSRFQSVAGTAESSGLSPASVDLIVSAQAFHWFDPAACRTEFRRILKPGGWVALIWNERRTRSDSFSIEYEAFLKRHARDYEKVNHVNTDEAKIGAFFSPSVFTLRSLPNQQVFDFEGLLGRVASSSYMPNTGESGFEAMQSDLNDLFTAHSRSGKVTVLYETMLYLGQLGG